MVLEPIEKRVDEVLASSTELEAAWLQEFVKQLAENRFGAERSLSRAMFLFLGVWCVSYLIGEGAVEEFGLGPAKVHDISQLLITAPIILGFLSYSIASSLSSLMTMGTALEKFYSKAIPKLATTDLVSLLSRHGFLGAENMLRRDEWGWDRYLNRAVLVIVVLFPTLIPPIAVIHTSWLAIQMNLAPWYSLYGASILGMFFWVRGVVLFSRHACM